MPSFEQDHFFLLELANIFEPLHTQHFGQSFTSFESIWIEELWDEHLEGPTLVAEVNSTPQHWYTKYWNFCAFAHTIANLDGYDFCAICDYAFNDKDSFYDHETIYTGHPLDLY